MTASTVLFSTILILQTALTSPAPTTRPTSPTTTPAPSAELARIASARPEALKVDMAAEPNHLAIKVKFRLKGSHAPGELLIDLWSRGDEAIVESHFFVRGRVHLTARQVYGTDHHQLWMSPTLEAELSQSAPHLSLAYLAILTDPDFITQIEARLGQLPSDPLAGNAACGVTKWGLKSLLVLAGMACCAGGFGIFCAACGIGAATGVDAINDGIDCKKECKPDCPIS